MRAARTPYRHSTRFSLVATPINKAIVAPSMLSCDLSNICRDSQLMLELGADWLHMDVMDGHFVPNLTFGPPVIAGIRKSLPDVYLDCHMMVSQPAKWVGPMSKSGCSCYNFHYESEMPEGGHKALIKAIKDAGMKVGMTLKPKTPADVLFPFLDDLDMVMIMTVEPGFSGQKFMADQMPKIKVIRDRCPLLDIQVDGGVAPATVDLTTQAGANVIVAASAIWNSDDRAGVIKILRDSVLTHGKGCKAYDRKKDSVTYAHTPETLSSIMESSFKSTELESS